MGEQTQSWFYDLLAQSIDVSQKGIDTALQRYSSPWRTHQEILSEGVTVAFNIVINLLCEKRAYCDETLLGRGKAWMVR